MKKILGFCVSILFIGNSALACQYFANPADGIVYVEAGKLFYCEISEDREVVDVFNCSNENNTKTLIIDKSTRKAELNGEKCEQGTFPNFCIWSGSC